MKKRKYIFAIAFAIVAIAFSACQSQSENKLVILHTNDTHSQIDPSDDGFGGVLRRQVLIDSIRAAEENVLLVDAGDVVQGTLYFLLYGGDVETKMMNALGYEIMTLGNHEFDNGMEKLRNQLQNLNAEKVITNYDLTETPLDSIFVPYIIKEYGGKRVAVMGLTLDPKGMISSRNSKGVKYLDAVETADSVAAYLKESQNADIIVALTHVGYENKYLCDTKIAKETKNIDVIIGGHSHTEINPQDPNAPTHLVENAAGKQVLIAQAGGAGKYLGEITINLDNKEMSSRLILVDSRLDECIDAETEQMLQPYHHEVDSLMSIIVANSAIKLERKQPPLINLISDFIKLEGERLSGKPVDVAFMNKGGIRNDLPQGDISEGHLMMTFPFDNYVTVIELQGKDLIDAFAAIASRYHLSVNEGVEMAIDTINPAETKALIKGEPIVANKTYRVATIDYLSEGGDYMAPLEKGKEIARSKSPIRADLIKHLSGHNKQLNPPAENRIYFK